MSEVPFNVVTLRPPDALRVVTDSLAQHFLQSGMAPSVCPSPFVLAVHVLCALERAGFVVDRPQT